jgi:hypothetical protein
VFWAATSLRNNILKNMFIKHKFIKSTFNCAKSAFGSFDSSVKGLYWNCTEFALYWNLFEIYKRRGRPTACQRLPLDGQTKHHHLCPLRGPRCELTKKKPLQAFAY